jgi:hypothetical protein
MIVYEAPRLRQGESAEVLGRVKAPPYPSRPMALTRPAPSRSASTDEAQQRRPMHAVRELEEQVGRSQESGSYPALTRWLRHCAGLCAYPPASAFMNRS